MWNAVFLSLAFFGAVRADLLDTVATLSESALTRLMDAYIRPPPRTTGFETLVPNENIRLHCIKPGATYFQEVFNEVGFYEEKFNFTAPMTIFIHGWQTGSNDTLYTRLTDNYLRYVKDTNYCVMDWKPYAAFSYEIAARKSVPVVAQYLFSFLQFMSVIYLPMENVSLVGFSMGGQIAGLAGKLMNGRVGSIFALDPAGPLFSHPKDVGPTNRLADTDAKYVQVLYTSRYTVGFGPLVGTQNFLPNKGYHPQEPCKKVGDVSGNPLLAIGNALYCSHTYAVRLFTETLDPFNVVYGQKCMKIFGAFLCTPSLLPKDRVGFYAERKEGNFYL